MLAKPDAEVVYEEGKAVGVSSEGETAKAKLVSHAAYHITRRATADGHCACEHQHHLLLFLLMTPATLQGPGQKRYGSPCCNCVTHVVVM